MEWNGECTRLQLACENGACSIYAELSTITAEAVQACLFGNAEMLPCLILCCHGKMPLSGKMGRY